MSTTEQALLEKKDPQSQPAKTPPPDANRRGVIAEWTVTILLLLFGTTTLVQAFVIPTGSMEDSLLIGDHLLVDKLSYAPADSVGQYLLPYVDVKRGDIIVFRYPIDLSQTFVKRVVGVPGDHIRIVNKQVYLNGQAVEEPYVVHKTSYIDAYRDNFPSPPNTQVYEPAIDMLENHVVDGEVVVPPGHYFRDGRQPRSLARQPLLGLRAAREHHRQAADRLLVLRCADRAALRRRHLHGAPAGPDAEFLFEDALEPHVLLDPSLRADRSMTQPENRDPHVYAVILAGGRGTRFWPRSRRGLPKQLLPVVGEQSLLVQTVERLAPLIPPERVWVLTSELLRAQTLQQIPQVPSRQVIAEPVQRNTGPAIALAAHLISREDPDAVFGVFPSDHYISKNAVYLRVVERAYRAARREQLIVLGIRPALAGDRLRLHRVPARRQADARPPFSRWCVFGKSRSWPRRAASSRPATSCGTAARFSGAPTSSAAPSGSFMPQTAAAVATRRPGVLDSLPP